MRSPSWDISNLASMSELRQFRVIGVYARFFGSCRSNGYLSQLHHSGRGLSAQRLQVLTVIHNFALHNSDNTTAAECLFSQQFPDLFEYLVQHLDKGAQKNIKETFARGIMLERKVSLVTLLPLLPCCRTIPVPIAAILLLQSHFSLDREVEVVDLDKVPSSLVVFRQVPCFRGPGSKLVSDF